MRPPVRILSLVVTVFAIAAITLAGCGIAPVAPTSAPGASSNPQTQGQTTGVVANSTAVPAATTAPQNVTDLESLYLKANPSVVNIQVSSQAVNINSSDTPQFQVGEGSGFVYDNQGHIVTNNHVVAGATSVYVTFADNTTYQAKVIGTDPNSDLAVIQVQSDAAHSIPLTLGDSDKVLVGEMVVAIGNPFGLQGTMTYGIVSALGRTIPASNNSSSSSSAVYTIPDIIQTDAAINPGNSGGPLLNMQGEVIGINAAIESSSNSSAGIGFTIPSNIVKKVIPVLIKTGTYQWPRLGITSFTVNGLVDQALGLPADQTGVMVVAITPGSPAEKAGLQAATGTVSFEGSQIPSGGDVITAIDGTKVNQFDDLISYLARSATVGQTVNLTVLRNGQTITVPITLDARPAQ